MEDFQLIEDQPRGERWDPLGAPNDEDEEQASSLKSLDHEYCDYNHCTIPMERLRSLEEEQELLSQSLCALTTHFAQVQFRLRQIVDAPVEDKECLLKSLEEFAFRGIPEVTLAKDITEDATLAEAMLLRRCQQKEMISKLKAQLRELELYAFESGEAGVPQDVLLERQQVILDELKSKMNLELDEQTPHKLTPAEVRQQVDVAFGQLVNPLRMKEHLVAQLKTQVADLERFIEYLQVDVKQSKCSCGCAKHAVRKPGTSANGTGMIQRTAVLLQMFAMLQLGCGSQPFKKNKLKTTMKANHWGDLRARLEVAIVRVLELVVAEDGGQGDYSSDNESPTILCDVKLTTAVRKHLASSIRDLMQHGAITTSQAQSVVPFMGCFSRRNSVSNVQTHAWEIVLEYYHRKNGERYNSTPARKLSQSFNLDLAGNSGNSNKQNMLCAIGSIISTHTPYKRGYDSHFKAFICAALNANKLVPWLNLIFQCHHIIHNHYQPWSYIAKTGFQDGLESLDALSHIKFDLPVDLAVRQFQNIKDVFT